MNIEALDKIKDIMTFSQLLDIFQEWQNCENSEEYNDLYSIGYSQLICYPAIVLTKDFTYKELEAAQKCYEICQAHVSESMVKLAQSGDNKAKLTLAMEAIPPEKRLLASSNEFYLLHYLLNAISQNPDIKNLSLIDGNDFAKQWNFIFERGYRGNGSKNDLDADTNHRVLSRRLINQMSLNDDNKILLSDDSLKPRFSKYYHTNSSQGNGCMIYLIIAIASGILISCI